MKIYGIDVNVEYTHKGVVVYDKKYYLTGRGESEKAALESWEQQYKSHTWLNFGR